MEKDKKVRMIGTGGKDNLGKAGKKLKKAGGKGKNFLKKAFNAK